MAKVWNIILFYFYAIMWDLITTELVLYKCTELHTKWLFTTKLCSRNISIYTKMSLVDSSLMWTSLQKLWQPIIWWITMCVFFNVCAKEEEKVEYRAWLAWLPASLHYHHHPLTSILLLGCQIIRIVPISENISKSTHISLLCIAQCCVLTTVHYLTGIMYQ